MNRYPFQTDIALQTSNLWESSVNWVVSIPGSPPNLLEIPTGCLFAERCPFETDICSQEIPVASEVEPGHFSFCHHIERIEEMRERASQGNTWVKKGIV